MWHIPNTPSSPYLSAHCQSGCRRQVYYQFSMRHTIQSPCKLPNPLKHTFPLHTTPVSLQFPPRCTLAAYPPTQRPRSQRVQIKLQLNRPPRLRSTHFPPGMLQLPRSVHASLLSRGIPSPRPRQLCRLHGWIVLVESWRAGSPWSCYTIVPRIPRCFLAARLEARGRL